MKTTKEIGNQAETKACEYLVKKKFKIIERNWRSRTAEIDIIAKRKFRPKLYFIEVKYRKNDNYGSALENIDERKLTQMYYAAEEYLITKHLDSDFTVGAIEVYGADFLIGEVFLEILDY